jgi:hypothetical protein
VPARRIVSVPAKEAASMTDHNGTGPTPPEEQAAASGQQEPDTSHSEDDPGYLVESGEAVGDDGSVAPIIGGLPAVEGSAWDIGAPLDERGGEPEEEQDDPPHQPGDKEGRG